MDNTMEIQTAGAQALEELAEYSKRAEREKRNRERMTFRLLIAAVIFLAVAVTTLSIALIICGIGWSHEQGTIVPEVLTVEKEVTVEVPKFTILDPSVEYDRALSDETFTLNDSSYGPIRMPVYQNVPKTTLTPELFVADPGTGYMTYLGPDEYMAGVDVSVYQGDIDWDDVKAAGFDFAMIRCGNRGYVTGLTVEDSKFKQNIEGALDAGLQVGVYFFSQALSMEEALEEAEFIIDLLDGYDVTFPVAFDWEVVNDPDGDTPRTAYIDPEQLTNNFLVFAQRLELEGYTPVLYANKKTTVWKYDLPRIAGYDIWYAEYNDTPSLPYRYAMWQYSSKGSVPGISGNVDLNICFKNFGEE